MLLYVRRSIEKRRRGVVTVAAVRHASGVLWRRSDRVGAVLRWRYAVGLSARRSERKTAQPVKGHAVAVLFAAALVFICKYVSGASRARCNLARILTL